MSLPRRAFRSLFTAPLPTPFIESSAYRACVELFESLPVTGKIVLVGDSLIAFAPWAELLGPEVVSRGIGGDRMKGVIQRLPAIMAQKPKEAFLLAGINDLLDGTTTDQLVGYFGQVDPSVKIISILPTHDLELNKKIREVNQRINLSVDVYSDFVGLDRIAPEFTCDGIHLSVNGYRLLASKLGIT